MLNVYQNVLSLLFVALTVMPGCNDDEAAINASYTPADCPQVKPDASPEATPPGAGLADGGAEETEEVPPLDEISEEIAGEEEVETPVEEAPPADPANEAPLKVIDINTASLTELMELPGVGPSLAQRIVDYRKKRKFGKPSHIRRVRGIGPATFKKMKEMVVVE